MNEARFRKALLQDDRKVVGRIDSRFLGDAINHIAETFRYDPFFPAVGPAFMATFNDYYREELGVKTDRTYGELGVGLRPLGPASQDPGLGTVPVPNTAIDLAWTMTQNPKMRLLVQQGCFDLATPYGALHYVLDHLDIYLQRSGRTLPLRITRRGT